VPSLRAAEYFENPMPLAKVEERARELMAPVLGDDRVNKLLILSEIWKRLVTFPNYGRC
jgi:hypothetical protein